MILPEGMPIDVYFHEMDMSEESRQSGEFLLKIPVCGWKHFKKFMDIGHLEEGLYEYECADSSERDPEAYELVMEAHEKRSTVLAFLEQFDLDKKGPYNCILLLYHRQLS